MGPTRSRTIALLALAAASPALEATVLVGLHFEAAQGLAPQATAVWPYDSYHDLRWLLVYHNSWLGFALELLAVVVVRGLLTAALIALAWPPQTARPSFRRLALRNTEVAILAAVIISPWAALSVAAAAVALSWFLLASLIPLLLLSPFLQRAGVVGDWWRGLPSVELVGWSLLNFAVLTVVGALVSVATGWWVVPVAGAAGVANGLLWKQTVYAAALPRRVRWQRVPVAPLAVVLTLVAAVAAQAVIGVAAGGRGEWRPPIVSERLPADVRYAVIAIAGHGSAYDGRPPVDPMVERFSYRGLDSQGRPLPYGPLATHRSLESSATVLAAQVDGLHRRTGRPVALLGESEGAMVARTYLEKWPRSPVAAALLFSPLVQAGRTYYPPAGAGSGWGVAAGWEVRAIFWLANLAGRKENPDDPFVRSMLDNGPFYRNRTLCPECGQSPSCRLSPPPKPRPANTRRSPFSSCPPSTVGWSAGASSRTA